MGGPLPAGLPFALQLDRAAPRPLRRQLAEQLRAAVQDGRLPPGTALPSSRALAAELGVARGVVVDAYADLLAEGSLTARGGSGTRVARGAGGQRMREQDAGGPRTAADVGLPGWLVARPDAPVDRPPDAPIRVDFQLGRPTLHTLDQRAWRRSWAQAGRPPPADYGDPQGEPAFRQVLAAHLTRSRGLPCRADELLVCGGALQGLGLVARTLSRAGAEPLEVAFENPGYPLARAALQDAGARLLPAPLDEDGLIVSALPPARLVYVTPSHQYPLGARMSAARRLELLEWARRHDALILEDDYDGEYRHGAAPLPTLASLPGGERVIYLGTLSKVLTPGLRVGYLRPPPALLPTLVREKTLSDYQNPWPVQAAMTQFLGSGQLERHIRRSGRHYAQLSRALTSLLEPLGPRATLGGIEAGLHACLRLHGGLRERAVASLCLERGVRVRTLDEFWLPETRRDDAPQALLLGYGGLSAAQLQAGAAVVADAVASARPS